MNRVLVVDDNHGMRRSLEIVLQQEGLDVATAPDGNEALVELWKWRPQVIVSDLRMEPLSGIELLQQIKEQAPSSEVILMTAYATIDSAVMAIKLGAFDYVTKPFKNQEIATKVHQALEQQGQTSVVTGNPDHRRQVDIQSISPCCERMQTTLELVAKIAPTDLTVLMTGETGTGKSFFTRLIHDNSPRAHRPLLSINCAALPDSLLESELFGHEKGAFTGAVRTRRGLFEEADGSTLVLDEIGALPLCLQAKLLGILQDREVRRVGHNQSIPVDVRIIAATNTDLEKAVREGDFRQDLFYRLNVARIHLPPLRERREDISHLIRYLIDTQSKRDQQSHRISPEAMELLCRHHFPGNIRELENALAWAAAVAPSDLITPRELPETIRSASTEEAMQYHQQPNPSLEEQEKAIIMKTLAQNGGNMFRTAETLGIGRTTLWRKLRKFQV